MLEETRGHDGLLQASVVVSVTLRNCDTPHFRCDRCENNEGVTEKGTVYELN